MRAGPDNYGNYEKGKYVIAIFIPSEIQLQVKYHLQVPLLVGKSQLAPPWQPSQSPVDLWASAECHLNRRCEATFVALR